MDVVMYYLILLLLYRILNALSIIIHTIPASVLFNNTICITPTYTNTISIRGTTLHLSTDVAWSLWRIYLLCVPHKRHKENYYYSYRHSGIFVNNLPCGEYCNSFDSGLYKSKCQIFKNSIGFSSIPVYRFQNSQ